MTDIVERLKAFAWEIETITGGPAGYVTAMSEAAAEIERLRAEHEVTAADLHAWMKLKAAAEARLAEAEALLHNVYFASRIDVLMEGPRLSGWNRPELDRLWPELRDFVAKLEQKP